MGVDDTFSIEGLDISVTETTDALTYTFTPQNPKPKLKETIALVLVPFGYPLCVLALVVYALIISGANRPVWELVLTGLFVLQLVAWLVFLGSAILRTNLGSRFRKRVVLAFTGTSVRHGSDHVCELADVRGLRVFIYSMSGDPPDKFRAALSLVIGDESGTHGLLGRLDATGLRALADDMQRRLAAFRFNQGLQAALDPLAVVETTREDAARSLSTRSPTRRTFRSRVTHTIVKKPWWACSAWCVVMLAGLFSSGRLVLAVGLDPAFLAGHAGLVVIHLLLLAQWIKDKKKQ
jgi:hypothetical protein